MLALCTTLAHLHRHNRQLRSKLEMMGQEKQILEQACALLILFCVCVCTTRDQLTPPLSRPERAPAGCKASGHGRLGSTYSTCHFELRHTCVFTLALQVNAKTKQVVTLTAEIYSTADLLKGRCTHTPPQLIGGESGETTSKLAHYIPPRKREDCSAAS